MTPGSALSRLVYFNLSKEASNDIIAGNGRVLKAYIFIVWLYFFETQRGPFPVKIVCKLK